MNLLGAIGRYQVRIEGDLVVKSPIPAAAMTFINLYMVVVDLSGQLKKVGQAGGDGTWMVQGWSGDVCESILYLKPLVTQLLDKIGPQPLITWPRIETKLVQRLELCGRQLQQAFEHAADELTKSVENPETTSTDVDELPAEYRTAGTLSGDPLTAKVISEIYDVSQSVLSKYHRRNDILLDRKKCDSGNAFRRDQVEEFVSCVKKNCKTSPPM